MTRAARKQNMVRVFKDKVGISKVIQVQVARGTLSGENFPANDHCFFALVLLIIEAEQEWPSD